MTEQEAMEVLKQPCLCDYDLSNTVLDCDIKQCDKRDAVLQAIKALEEICQYRAIGTPEECKNIVLKITEAYNKAIDDFRAEICKAIVRLERNGNYRFYAVETKQYIADLAEQLKAGDCD